MGSSGKNNPKQIQEVPKVSEDTLLGLTIASAVMSILGVFFCWAYVFVLPDWFIADTPDSQTIGDRARAVTPFLAAGAAVVTFFSVVWRGAINSRQADEDRRANDSRDEAELALLLEKANVLLSESATKAAQENTMSASHDRSLALALLETIAIAENAKYSGFALEFTINQIVPIHRDGGINFDRHIAQVQRIFDRALERGRTLSEITTLNFDPEDTNTFDATAMRAFVVTASLPPVLISGARVKFTDEAIDLFNKGKWWNFSRCQIFGRMEEPLITDYDRRFGSSEIFGAKIVRLGSRSAFDPRSPKLKYRRCDLSGTEITDPSELHRQEFVDCHFRPDEPPVYTDGCPGDPVEYIRSRKLGIWS